jgi:hypothetical protein
LERWVLLVIFSSAKAYSFLSTSFPEVSLSFKFYLPLKPNQTVFAKFFVHSDFMVLRQ